MSEDNKNQDPSLEEPPPPSDKSEHPKVVPEISQHTEMPDFVIEELCECIRNRNKKCPAPRHYRQYAMFLETLVDHYGPSDVLRMLAGVCQTNAKIRETVNLDTAGSNLWNVRADRLNNLAKNVVFTYKIED